MNKKDDLGDRMKNYENIHRNFLSPKNYYILRIDGKSFHSYTKGMEKPFDETLIGDMQETTKYLCENIQGAQFGYTQSDEITIVFTDLMGEVSDIWFGGNIQKIISVAASMATAKFNHLNFDRVLAATVEDFSNAPFITKLAHFDARVFTISQRHEVLNNLYWRQKDASKNSVQMLARSLFSHKSLQNLNGNELQDKMMIEKNVNWNDLEVVKKRGTCVYKLNKTTNGVTRGKWHIDKESPIFSKDWGWFDGKII